MFAKQFIMFVDMNEIWCSYERNKWLNCKSKPWPIFIKNKLYKIHQFELLISNSLILRCFGKHRNKNQVRITSFDQQVLKILLSTWLCVACI